MELPLLDPALSAVRMEMRRVVAAKFPDPSQLGEIGMRIILTSTYVERVRFAGEEGCDAMEFIFWAMVEAESTDPATAWKWREFKAERPIQLNVRRPRVGALAFPPPGALPPGVDPPAPI